MSNPESIKIDDIKYIREDKIESTIIQDPDSSVAVVAVGKKVIVRSRNEGINCGIVEAADSTGIILKGARRLWAHKPGDPRSCWYEGVANHGISHESKISEPVARKIIVEDYSVTYMSDDAYKSVSEAPSHKRS